MSYIDVLCVIVNVNVEPSILDELYGVTIYV